MTSGWPDVVARLHDTLNRCDRDTDLELAAGDRRLHLMVRRDTVRGICPAYDDQRLAGLGWRPPRGGGGWWFETPRTPQGLRWWSDFAARTAAAVLTDRPDALSCQVLPPTGPRVRPEPTVPPPGRPAGPARPPAAPAPTSPARPPATHGADGPPATHGADGPPATHGADGPPATHGADGPPATHGADGPPAADGADREVRERLAEAVARRDLAGYLGVLAGTVVCVPLAAEPSPQRDFPWTVVTDPAGAPLLPVFTSPEALTGFAGPGVPFLAVPCAELLADWPDAGWGLAADPGAPQALTLTAPALAALLAANDAIG
ncbi:SseB family protein [Micromonospora deserti]|uniref:SseB protein N-terminal domain-containing protein n=1 Tax=Micromonospora deserti TaxID=2070366 RepID=A0A2W2CQ12_9ACTN|nr:SseB family protein [Micromonospora deserti]PZF90459.1 hypothetical protein C1I99_24470 [Micromonospora deserti]